MAGRRSSGRRGADLINGRDRCARRDPGVIGSNHGPESNQLLRKGDAVPQPFIVSIPHKLGRDEAVRRLKAGLGSVKSQYGQVLQVNEEIWSGDRLAFRITALRQQASGTIDVADDHVRLEVILPWLLAGLAHGVQAIIRERGQRMLEKKEPPQA